MATRRTLPGNIEAPGVYIHEVSGGSRPIVAVGTSTAGFIGSSPVNQSKKLKDEDLVAYPLDNWTQFKERYFTNPPPAKPEDWTHLAHAVYGFFLNGGRRCWVVDVGDAKKGSHLTAGLDLLAAVDEVAILAAPGFTDKTQYAAIAAHLTKDGISDRVAILDAPQDQNDAAKLSKFKPTEGQTDRGHTTMYAPWIKVANPNPGRDSDGFVRIGETVEIPPSGHVAGIWARSDGLRGVAKAPANETIRGAVGLTHRISDQTQAILNNEGINALRYFRDSGYTVWGARTLAKDQEWQFLNVRRLFNMIEESIAESTRWVVFEPNDQLLWASIRRDVGAFLQDLWQQGMLMGTTPEEAYYVKCDAENNPFDSIRRGRVIIDIGIAPVMPAEFVIFRIGQYEAGTEVEIA